MNKKRKRKKKKKKKKGDIMRSSVGPWDWRDFGMVWKKESGGVDRENESLKWVKIMYQTCFLFYYYFLIN